MDLTSFLYALKPFALTLALPPVPFWGLMLLGAAVLRQRQAWGRGLLLIGFAGAWLSCTEGMGQLMALHAVKTPPALSHTQMEALRAEAATQVTLAVLVLGGGIRQDVPEYGSPRLNPITQERFQYGVWLAKQLQAPLAFSGGIGWTAKRQIATEAEVAAAMARDDYGQPLRWIEGRSRDTRENASLTVPLLKNDGVKTLVLVTHDLHMPRSLRAFRDAAGQDIKIIAAPVGLRRDAMSQLHDWYPSASGFQRVSYATYELIGLWAGH
ncbi:YdcF family protein [Roseateles sp.]|uniref:YdcF family protein n=1 Tax=Roseateles sp. TaxID=1971397 RepID=UPI003BA42F72